MSVEVASFVNISDGVFVPIGEADGRAMRGTYIDGYIQFSIDGVDVLNEVLWDDVDDLWAYVVQAVDECLRTGTGHRYFPDQPIEFQVDALPGGRLRFSVFTSAGDKQYAKAVGDRHEVLAALRAGALTFWRELERISPGATKGTHREMAIVEAWPEGPSPTRDDGRGGSADDLG
jgi:hypothetical protein